MWRILLVLAIVSCGKSKEDQERDKTCRSERDSAARYLQVASGSFDRITDAPEPKGPPAARPADKNPDIAFMEAALDDEGALANRGLAIAKADVDAHKKMSGPAKETLKHAIDELQKQDGDPVAAAKSAQPVFAQLDQLRADNVKQYEALIKDVIAVRDRIDAKPPDQIKDSETRELLKSVRESLDLQARTLEVASKPIDVFEVDKLVLQQVITACSK